MTSYLYIYLFKYITTVNAITITRKIAPPAPQAKMIYIFCFLLGFFGDVFFFPFPNKTVALERDEEETVLER